LIVKKKLKINFDFILDFLIVVENQPVESACTDCDMQPAQRDSTAWLQCPLFQALTIAANLVLVFGRR
jgi:hypothetical protein